MSKNCHSNIFEAKIHHIRKENYSSPEDAGRLFGIGDKKKDQNDIDPVVDDPSYLLLNQLLHGF